MKNKLIITIISFFISIAIGVIIYPIIKNKYIENKLIDTMYSKITYISEENKECFFNKTLIYGEITEPNKYTFVDLDGDKIKELAVLTKSDYGAYMIFRYDTKGKKIYGYMIGIRGFQALKKDGSFRGSNEAGNHSYIKIKFQGNDIIFIILAKDDRDYKKYEINNKPVSEKQIIKYVEEFDKKDECIWINAN